MSTTPAGSATSSPAAEKRPDRRRRQDVIGADLEPFYGTRVPWGGMVFVRLRAPEMSGHGAMGHAMHGAAP